MAIPLSFAGVALVASWSSWRQRPRAETDVLPCRLRLPLTGQWHPLHTPAHRVPSHGTHFLAQTYAFDFVAVNDELRTSPDRGWRTWFWLRRPDAFYAFEQPIIAPKRGTVAVLAEIATPPWSSDAPTGDLIE